jgi:hypothetical protein
MKRGETGWSSAVHGEFAAARSRKARQVDIHFPMPTTPTFQKRPLEK